MEDLAEQIVDELEPPAGWWKSDARERLIDVAVTMLQEMDQDSVEECMREMFGIVSAEYGE